MGVGYKAALSEDKRSLILKVGYSHDIIIPIPNDIQITVPMMSKIVLFGTNYQRISQFATKIRSHRKPEPYNGKGIFVDNETIMIKEGKKK